MDKKILIYLKNGDVFITNKNSFDITTWGVSAIGVFKKDNYADATKDEIQIPWGNVEYIRKLTS